MPRPFRSALSRIARAFRSALSRSPLAGHVRLPTDPIPATWPGLVADRVPLAARLASSDPERLYRLMQLFLDEVPIEGCAGLEVTEEIQVTIAAQACLLLLHLPYPRYMRVRRVLVYPSSFLTRSAAMPGTFQVVRPDVPARGQAWQSGIVVLGWDSVRQGTFAHTDGGNVVLHEFAHMLDVEDGSMDGIPVLESGSAYRAWASLLSAQFTEHVSRAERSERTTLDPYGAENPAEFFAVATEAFFQKPGALRADQPSLFARLADFYKLDPTLIGPRPTPEERKRDDPDTTDHR